MNKLTKAYDKAEYDLCYSFARNYFEGEEITDTDFECKYGFLFLNEGELVFSIYDIYQYFKYNIPMNVMLDWFDYCLSNKELKTNLYNFRRYKIIPKERLEKERLEGLKRAKENLNRSIQYFAEALGVDEEELLKSFNKK